MSLDVYLEMPRSVGVESSRGSGIFVREEGRTLELTEEEWQSRYPDRDPVRAVYHDDDDDATITVFHANITHNLGEMAAEAEIYSYLWHPEICGISCARELIAPLEKGLAHLLDNSQHYEKFNPANGWGNYDGLCRFVDEYLQACKIFPDAKVSVWG